MTDDSGIFEELRAERQELEHMIKVAKNIVKEQIILSASPFFSLEEKEGKLLITGIALAEGVWKSVLYPSEEIEKSALRLVGKPLKIEHGLDALFEQREVGKVKLAYYDKALKSIVFQAEVTDPKAISLVKDGTFPAVSCSTWVDKFPLNPDQSIGFNFDFNELSLVRTPACEKCFIFAVEELSKSQGKQDLNNQSPQLIKQEVKTMTEDNEEVIEELEEEVDLSEMEKPKLYAVVEVEALSDFEESLAKKVVSYYYGYPHPKSNKKYPYPGYPYYPYEKKEGKYPYKKPETKSLWALLELDSAEQIEELKKKGKKVKAVYYGYYGYPHKGYPYKEKKAEEYKCPEGQVWDEKTGKCVEQMAKTEYKCPEGQVWDEKAAKCVEAPKEEMAKKEEYKCPEGQVYDEKEKKCVEAKEQMSEEEELLEELALPKEYTAFMKKCMKESKTMPVIKRMKECAKAFKAQKPEEKAAEYKCPEGQIFDEKEKKCVPVEKKEAYPAPEKDSSREFTDMKPGPIEVTPGPAEQAATIAAKEKLSAETVKKEEAPIIPKVESPMAEPCKDCPKKEEEKASVPQTPEPVVVPPVPVEPKVEEVKVEPPKVEAPKEPEKPKEEPKTEPPKVEPPKEEPKVEAPKVEEKKPEEPKKEPTEEELKAYVKEHYAELILKLRKEKKFP